MADNATGLLRPRYFDRQQLSAADLMAGVNYLQERLRRHNRYLHGWGVVCGAQVMRGSSENPWDVRISEGYVVTPHGDEIYIPPGVTYDIRAGVEACLSIPPPCPAPTDLRDVAGEDEQSLLPTSELPVSRDIVYLAICPRTQDVCPQPAVPYNCQPPGGLYEYSRVRETYEFKVACDLPASHRLPHPTCEELVKIVCGQAHAPCPPNLDTTDNCVVLAAIAINPERNRIDIDDLSVRRQLLNAGLQLAYLRCQCGETPLRAAFHASTTSGEAPLTLQFTDRSTGVVESWTWNFGDGSTSTVQNPTHTYGAAGTYTVALTVQGRSGQEDTMTRTDYITVTNPLIRADFSYTLPHPSPLGLLVRFTDQSPGNIRSWHWSFGDGTPPNTEQNPVHTYSLQVISRGVDVTLTVGGPDGSSDSATKNIRFTPPSTGITGASEPPPVEEISGIGRVRGDKLRQANITNVLEFAAMPVEQAVEILGVSEAAVMEMKAHALALMGRQP